MCKNYYSNKAFRDDLSKDNPSSNTDYHQRDKNATSSLKIALNQELNGLLQIEDF